MYSIFGQVFDEQGNLRSNRYTIDLKNLIEVDVVGSAGLATLVQWLRRQSVSVEFDIPRAARRAIQRLYRELGGPPSGELLDDDRRSPFDISLCVLEPDRAADWVADAFVPWMARELYVSSAIASSRTRPLRELFLNASSHSYCRRVIAAAHCAREQQEITCVVSDDGIGIPESVRRVWKEPINDTVAIARAIEAGFSTVDTGDREGKGLSRVVEYVVHRCNGQVVIHSGFGIVRCRVGVGNFVTNLEAADAFFPGTLFVVIFPGAPLGRMSLMNDPAPEHAFYGEPSA